MGIVSTLPATRATLNVLVIKLKKIWLLSLFKNNSVPSDPPQMIKCNLHFNKPIFLVSM